MPMRVAAKLRQPILIHLRQIAPLNQNLALISLFQTSHHHQQGRLARAGWPHKPHRMSTFYVEINSAQNIDPRIPCPEAQIDTMKRNNRVFCGHCIR